MLANPTLMGIVNVTPDSFSDGGKFMNHTNAIEHGLKLLSEGADILDIGGESTRPGAAPVSVEEELSRVIPVIEGLAAEVKRQGKVISIDTRHAKTMEKALEAGAGMINDIAALSGPGSLEVAAVANVPVCLMHMQGDPQSMQKNPKYNNVVEDVLKFLIQVVERAVKAGISPQNIILDPGIGFGKTLEQNKEILMNLERFTALTYPVLLGASRKTFIEKMMNQTVPPQDRLAGSLAAALRGLEAGVKIFRVHDVLATRQAIEVYSGIKKCVQERVS